MSNPFYTFVSRFIPGAKAKSGSVNAQLDAIVAGFDGVNTALAAKAASDHTHSGVYSPVAHNHDGTYAAAAHTHAQYLDVPSRSTTTTLVADDAGQSVKVTADIEVPAGVFAEGKVVALDNVSAGVRTITAGAGLTMYLVGTTTTGNRTLARNGQAVIRFRSASECVISGAGLS